VQRRELRADDREVLDKRIAFVERKARETLKKYGCPTDREGLQRRRVGLDNKEQIALNKELATILERQEIQESSDQEWSRVHAIRERMDKITKTAWESTPEQVKTVDALFMHLGRVKTDLMSGLWEDAVASMYGVGRCAALVGIEGFARTFGEKKEMAGSRRFARTVVANKAFGIAGGVIAQDAAAPMAPPPYRQGRERVEEAQADTRSRSNLSTSEPESEDEKLVQAKIHPDLAVLVAAGGQGKVKIEVWLADATPETLAALKKLGFETVGTPKVAKIVGGRIEIGKVEALARLAGVRYIKLLTLYANTPTASTPGRLMSLRGFFLLAE